MRTHRLGDLEVGALGLGCMGMTGSYGAADDGEAIATIHRALELGVTLLDTAHYYAGGANEALIGRALAGRRDHAVIASKTGARAGAHGFEIDGTPASITAACDAALDRLRTDHLDVLILGRVDPKVPIEESVGAMARLVEAGKVRRLGLSEASPRTIRRAAAVHRLVLLETEYSLGERHVEAAILATLRELDIGLLAYSPLGRGLFGGALHSRDDLPADDWRRNHPRFTDETFARNQAAVTAIDPIVARHGATRAQIALAWLLAQGADIVPIPGAKRRAHLDDNAGATSLSLSAADVAALAAAFPPGAIAGERYPAAGMKSIDRD